MGYGGGALPGLPGGDSPSGSSADSFSPQLVPVRGLPAGELWSVPVIEAGINGSIRSFYCEQVVCKTGAKEFLQALRERGIPAVLATATDRAVMMEGLRRTGLLPLLDAVYTCGELGVDKRTPALFHHARAQMGTAIEATWVFEDAVHAAQTAYQAGYRVAGVADPYSDQEALKATCHWYLTDWTDFAGFYQQA